MNIESSIALAGAVIAIFVSVVNAMNGAKKTDVDILRGIIDELRKDNTSLKASISTLEADKLTCMAALAELQKLLPNKKVRRAHPEVAISASMNAAE